MKYIGDEIDALTKQIEDLQGKLLDKIEEKKRFEELTPVKKLAIVIHDNMCNSNHTDQCGWLYEIDGYGRHNFNSGSTHLSYEQKAKKILNNLLNAFPDSNPERLYEIAKTVFLSLK